MTPPASQQPAKAKKPYKVPSIADLHSDNLEIAYQHDELNILLAQMPHSTWVSKHPTIMVKDPADNMVKAEYIKSTILRAMLRKIFMYYTDEILREGIILNSCYAVVRIHYWHPVFEEMRFVDGVGAVDIQKGKNTPELNAKTIVSAAVQKALPSAAEYAFKNACKKLGRLFGGELNKNCQYVFTPSFDHSKSDTAGTAAPNDASNTEMFSPATTVQATPPPHVFDIPATDLDF